MVVEGALGYDFERALYLSKTKRSIVALIKSKVEPGELKEFMIDLWAEATQDASMNRFYPITNEENPTG